MKRKILCILLTLVLVFSLLPVTALAAYSDVKDHWAQAAIEKWSSLGIVQGNDGKFRADDPITRGEVAVIIDRIMKYQTKAQNTFSDLGQAYYTDAILKANAAGVITGSGNTVRPTANITREEATVMLARALGVEESLKAASFSDLKDVSSWARGFVNAMAARGFVNGADGRFNPKAYITRASIVTILNNAIAQIYSSAQEYSGDVTGTVIINTAGAVLKNMTISGDLIIAQGVGNGDVTLNNVKVTGNTIVRGGGPNSIHISGNSQLSTLIIEKTDDGQIRVVTSDGSIVDVVFIDDGKDDVILTGTFGNISINAGINVNAVGAHITSANINAPGAVLMLDTSSNIGTLTVDAQANIINNGVITRAEINDSNVGLGGNKPGTIIYGTGVLGVKDINNGGGGGPGPAPGPGVIDAATPTITTDVAGSTNTTVGIAVTLSVTATTSDSGVLSYQWYSNTSAVTTGGTAISGATSATYQPDVSSVVTSYYYCVVTNTNNSVNGTKTATKTSSAATINVALLLNAATPSITTDVAGSTNTTVGTAVTLSVAAAITDSGTLSYQWYSNTSAATTGGTAISGATTASYLPNVSSIGTSYYYCVVTNTNNTVNGTKTAAKTSSAATVIVSEKIINAATPTITTDVTSATTTIGVAVTLSVAATVSDTGTLSYQWYSNTSALTTGGTAITGATAASYSPNVSSAGTSYYYCVVTNTNNSVNGTKTASRTSSAAVVLVEYNAVVDAAYTSSTPGWGSTRFASIQEAVNTVSSGSTIAVKGTIGSLSSYTAYEITKPVTIKGIESNPTVYGSFIIKTDGVTVDGLKIYTRGGGNGPLKNAIDVIAKTVTITHNTFELPNPSALGASGGVGNGVTIWPNGSADPNYNISGNTFIGYTASTPDWSSSALQIAEGLNLARFSMSSVTSGVVTLSPAVEAALATGNTYTDCTNNYVHSNWTSGIVYKYVYASTTDQLSGGIQYAGSGATILVAPGPYAANLTINKSLSLLSETPLGAKLTGSITIGNTTSETSNVTVDGFEVAAGSATLPVIHLINASNITISNNNVTATTGSLQLSIGTSTGPAKVTGVISNNTVYGAIGLGTEGNLEVKGNTVTYASHEGIWFYPVGAAAELKIQNNSITGYGKVAASSPAVKVVSKPAKINDVTTDTLMAADITGKNSGATVELSWIKSVMSPADLTAAISAAKNGDTIVISGTIGSESSYTAYEITKAIKIMGQPGAKIYGSFIIKTDGITVDGLTIYTRGGGNGPLKNAIDVIAKTVTITNNTFVLPNPSALGASGGVGNGVTIWPNGSAAPNYNISGNTFTGYTASTPDWSSSALQIAEGLNLARFSMSSVTSGVVTLSPAVEAALATGNTYTDCTYNYVHSNWTSGIVYKYVYAKTSAQLLDGMEYAGDNSTILLASGTYTLTSTVGLTANKVNLIGAGKTLTTIQYNGADQGSGLFAVPVNSGLSGKISFSGIGFANTSTGVTKGNYVFLSFPGTNANEAAFDNCSFNNFYTVAYFNNTHPGQANNNKISITNCVINNTAWVFSQDDVSVGSSPILPANVILTGNTGDSATKGQEVFSGVTVRNSSNVSKGIYATITAAIGAATAGDTITVAPGTYKEDVVINKQLTIIGAGAQSTKIVGATIGVPTGTSALSFNTNGATVSGFTITHEYTADEITAWNFNNNGVNFGQGTTGNTLRDCVVTLSRNGVYLNNCQGNTITNNTITNNRTGINMCNNIGNTQITGNMISSNWTIGLVFYDNGASANLSTVTVSGNTFNGNWYTEILVKGATPTTPLTSTGTLDVSSNTFTDSPVTFTRSTDASLDEPGFASQKPNVPGIGGTAVKPAVDLPTLRNSSSKPGALQYAGKTMKVGTTPDSFATIQAAVDAAASGDIILVATGTYNASFTIVGKTNLTIKGADKATTIIAPTAPLLTTTAHKYTTNMKASVFINGSTGITLQDLTISGGGNNPDAIVFWNASSGKISNVIVSDSTPLNGNQTGQGIAVDASGGQSSVLAIENTDISGFMKNGIDVLNGNGTRDANGGTLTVNVTGGSITGAGATNVNCQNGMVFWDYGLGSVGGSVTNVQFKEINYTGADISYGILDYRADTSPALTITGCTYTNVKGNALSVNPPVITSFNYAYITSPAYTLRVVGGVTYYDYNAYVNGATAKTTVTAIRNLASQITGGNGVFKYSVNTADNVVKFEAPTAPGFTHQSYKVTSVGSSLIGYYDGSTLSYKTLGVDLNTKYFQVNPVSGSITAAPMPASTAGATTTMTNVVMNQSGTAALYVYYIIN